MKIHSMRFGTPSKIALFAAKPLLPVFNEVIQFFL